MRTSQDQFNEQGILLNGFDYDNQAWVRDGKYVRCGHPETMNCGCFGREHEGQNVRVTNEDALTTVEHAISYLSSIGYPDDSILLAIGTLYEAHKAVGPCGQIPSWEVSE